jgi:hypothetical protein
MESQEQQPKSRVIKVESVESWDFYITQATNQACPVSFFLYLLSFTIAILGLQQSF